MTSRSVDIRGVVGIVVSTSLIACDPPAATTDEPAAGAATPVPAGPGKYTVRAPLRADDLRPGHYLSINHNPGLWHDLNVVRWDEDAKAWTGLQKGGSGEFDELDWNLPVYAGVAGEVISCWRNNPFDPDYQDELQEGGGNHLVIRTDDGRYVFYGHLQTSTIPAHMCPNESDSGWYSHPEVRFPAKCPEGYHGAIAEAYVDEPERARVEVGQFIGRVGAHGRASGAHVHMHAGNVAVVGDGAPCISSARYELDFDDVWYQAGGVAPHTTPWLPGSEANLAVVAQATSVRLWPAIRHEATFAEPPRMAGFDEPGILPRDDLLCHDVRTGTLWLDYAADGRLAGTDWRSDGDFCSAEHLRLHKGDFDGDGRSDLLCHDLIEGRRTVLFADEAGHFTGAVEYVQELGWCAREGEQLRVGDFNGDGRDDLLCHDMIAGALQIDLSSPGSEDMPSVPFHGTDIAPPGAWCREYSERLHVGDFDGDGRADLLCHDVLGGGLRVDLAEASLTFEGTDFARDDAGFCRGGGQRVYVGDFSADGRDDLLCHDSDDGDLEIRLARAGDALLPLVLDWFRDDSGWCTGPDRRVMIGDVGGDERVDLVCHDQSSGMRAIDVMDPIAGKTAGGFRGTDWSDDSPWCRGEAQGVH